MSWKESSKTDEKLKFIADWLKDEFKTSDLCKRYNISRSTGYDLINRYLAEGVDAFTEKSTAPHHIPHKTSKKVESKLIQLKFRYPHWGPGKIRDYLIAEGIKGNWPAKSTIGEIFKKHGLVKPRKLRRRIHPHSEPLIHCQTSNDVWSADFKGHFLLANNKYCYPLTITDNFSRFLFACDGFLSPTCDNAIKSFERIFEEYGLPDAIRTDNGQPFCSFGFGGLTRLSIWFLKLGIMPERIDLGAPQQNGRHERMHRTLKEATIVPKKNGLKAQNKIFSKFIQEFNFERPHEALYSKRPAEVYIKSKKQLPNKIQEVFYPDEFLVRKVKMNGEISFGGKKYYVSELLYKEPIGLEKVDDDRAIVYFSKLKLGLIDIRSDKIIRP